MYVKILYVLIFYSHISVDKSSLKSAKLICSRYQFNPLTVIKVFRI